MVTPEKGALDVLLFDTEGEELLDIKCFRGDREDVSPEDIREQIHFGIMQYKMRPHLATSRSPKSGAAQEDVADLVRGLPIAA